MKKILLSAVGGCLILLCIAANINITPIALFPNNPSPDGSLLFVLANNGVGNYNISVNQLYMNIATNSTFVNSLSGNTNFTGKFVFDVQSSSTNTMSMSRQTNASGVTIVITNQAIWNIISGNTNTLTVTQSINTNDGSVTVTLTNTATSGSSTNVLNYAQLVLTNQQNNYVFNVQQYQVFDLFSSFYNSNVVSLSLTNINLSSNNAAFYTILIHNLSTNTLNFSWPTNYNWVSQAINGSSPPPTNQVGSSVMQFQLLVAPNGAVTGSQNP